MSLSIRQDYIRALIRIAEKQPSQELFERIERLLGEEEPRERKANGEGSVYLRKDGRWTASIRVNGRRRVVYGRTYEEARARLDAYIAEDMSGDPLPPSQTVATVNYAPEPPNLTPAEGEIEANDEQLAVIGDQLADPAPPDGEPTNAFIAPVAPKPKTGYCRICGNHTRSFAHSEDCGRGLRLPGEKPRALKDLGPVSADADIVAAPLTNEPELTTKLDTVDLSIFPGNIREIIQRPPTARCPRCKGRLILDDGEITCMACGWRKPPDSLSRLYDDDGRKVRGAKHAGARL